MTNFVYTLIFFKFYGRYNDLVCDYKFVERFYIIPFVKLMFPYWLWRRVLVYTQLRLRAHGVCDSSAENIIAYSSMTPYPTFAFDRGPCCPTHDFYYIYLKFIITFKTLFTTCQLIFAKLCKLYALSQSFF
jgi:hypothetical protein